MDADGCADDWRRCFAEDAGVGTLRVCRVRCSAWRRWCILESDSRVRLQCMSEPVKPRRQRSSAQREKSRATRRRIREAAERLFVRHGYLSTTIEAIAAEAAVAVQTVYFVFGTKHALLAEVLDVATAGDEAPAPIRERP